MQKRVCCLLMSVALILSAGAVQAGAESTEPLVYTLQESPVDLDKEYDEYIVSWEALPDVDHYEICIYCEMYAPTGRGSIPILMSGGYLVSERTVADGQGDEHRMHGFLFHEGVELGGDATSIDIAGYLSVAPDEILEPFVYMLVLIVPTAGEPVIQRIAIPIQEECSKLFRWPAPTRTQRPEQFSPYLR